MRVRTYPNADLSGVCVEDLAGRACQSGLDSEEEEPRSVVLLFPGCRLYRDAYQWAYYLTASVSCGVEERQKEAVSDGLFKK